MSVKRLLSFYGIVLLVISVPFTILHLIARPDDAPISPLQHVTAAVANFFGPWGVAIVRLVDFTNAGMRSFNLALAMGLTLLGAILIAPPALVKKRLLQYGGLVLWTAFTLVWFVVGFFQIASGLL